MWIVAVYLAFITCSYLEQEVLILRNHRLELSEDLHSCVRLVPALKGSYWVRQKKNIGKFHPLCPHSFNHILDGLSSVLHDMNIGKVICNDASWWPTRTLVIFNSVTILSKTFEDFKVHDLLKASLLKKLNQHLIGFSLCPRQNVQNTTYCWQTVYALLYLSLLSQFLA